MYFENFYRSYFSNYWTNENSMRAIWRKVGWNCKRKLKRATEDLWKEKFFFSFFHTFVIIRLYVCDTSKNKKRIKTYVFIVIEKIYVSIWRSGVAKLNLSPNFVFILLASALGRLKNAPLILSISFSRGFERFSNSNQRVDFIKYRPQQLCTLVITFL